MKSIFFVFAIFAAVFSASAATFTRPNMNSADSATLNAALEAATAPEQKAFVSIIMEINSKTPATFADLCAVVDRVSDKYSVGLRTRIFYKKQIAYCHKKFHTFLRDAAQFCIENPSLYDRVYIAGARTAKFFTDEQIYSISMRCLLEYVKSPSGVLRLIKVAVKASNCVSPDVVKSDFEKLNRRYSLLLVEDKAAWTPVVQAIRTAMETF